jgi:hypothetical protein
VDHGLVNVQNEQLLLLLVPWFWDVDGGLLEVAVLEGGELRDDLESVEGLDQVLTVYLIGLLLPLPLEFRVLFWLLRHDLG